MRRDLRRLSTFGFPKLNVQNHPESAILWIWYFDTEFTKSFEILITVGFELKVIWEMSVHDLDEVGMNIGCLTRA